MGKPAFDPSKSFAVADARVPDKPAFDPTQNFEPVPDKAPTMSISDAAQTKGAQGFTFGLAPLAAGAGAALGNLSGQPSGKPTDWQAVKDAFKEGRQGRIDLQNKAQEDHPTISTVANIGSSLISAPLLPIGAGAKGAMKMGAALGAANAAGSAGSVGEAAQDIGGGVAGGAAGYGLAKTVGAGASSALSGFAESKAYKAAGAMLKDFRSAFSKDPQKINELGRTMLDNGLVKMGDDVSSIAQKSEGLRRETGQKIGEVYDKVLSSITSPENQANITPEMQINIQSAGFHPEAQADEMKSIIAQKLKGQPGSTNAVAKANQVIDELAVNGNHITPQRALELKGSVDHMINWSKKSQDLPIEQDALKEVRGYIQNKLNNQVGALDQALGSKDSQELVRLNKLYGNVSTVANISRDRALREGANRSFGLTDTIAGGAGVGGGAMISGAMGHGPGLGALIGGAALGAGNKIARTYGNSALATGANALSRGTSNPNVYMSPINQSLEYLNNEFNPPADNSRTLSSIIKPMDKLKGR